MSHTINTIMGPVEIAQSQRQYSQAEEQQFVLATQQLKQNRWDFYTNEGHQHNTKLVADYFQRNKNIPVTVENIFKAVAERSTEFRSVSPAQAEFYKIASEDVGRAQQVETWLAKQGRPGTLINTGDDFFHNAAELLLELRGHDINPTTIQSAIARITGPQSVKFAAHIRKRGSLHFVDNPTPHKSSRHAQTDDGTPFLTAGLTKQRDGSLGKSPRDYAREREEASAKNRPSEPESINAAELRAKSDAESIRGKVHSHTSTLQKMFVNKSDGSVDWPATLNVRLQMQARLRKCS